LRTLTAERALRRRIRRSLATWARTALAGVGQTPAAHHLRLIAELEAVSRGEVDRLIVLMPPGSAKSTYASILFPVWWFTQHPASAVLAVAHTADLAAHFGRLTRNLVNEHHPRLGYKLAADKRAAASWHITTRGSYHGTGVRGPVVGRRADLILIDDPVKSQAEADSLSQRDNLWMWYRSDLTPRLKPGGRIVVIMTRWHEDDLGGRLLQGQERWRSLALPALAEADDPLGRAPGTALWPAWEDEAALLRKRAAVGERAWSALFQQRPMPLSGGLFRNERIVILETAPAVRGPVVRAWDLAASRRVAGANPDWTVGLKMMREESGRFVVLDVVRLQGGPHEVETAIVNTAEQDTKTVTIGLPQDPGQAGRAQVLYLSRLLAGFNVNASPESGAKETRALGVASQCAAGNLCVVRGRWTAAFLEELAGFPAGAKDDQVDALSRAFAMLTNAPAPARSIRLPFIAR